MKEISEDGINDYKSDKLLNSQVYPLNMRISFGLENISDCWLACRVNSHLRLSPSESLLAMLIVIRPVLIVLKMEMASLWDRPCTDSPLIDSISSPETFHPVILQLKAENNKFVKY